MAIGTLSIDLVAKLAKFEQDMGKAARASEKTAQQIEKSLGTIKAGFVALAGAISVNALTNYFQAIVDGADELGKLSQRTGIAVETLGGLGYAATLAGGDVNSLADAADKLNLQLAKAAGGDKTALQAFEALGISVTDLEGKTKSVDVALGEIADRFKTFADGPEKSALAIRLMSEAGARQIPLLNQGSEAIRAQAEEWKRYSGVTEQLTKDAELFNDTMSRIGLIASSVGTRVAAELLGPLQALADEFYRLQQASDGFANVGSAVRVVFEAVAVLAANVAFVLKGMGREIGAIAAQAVALVNLDMRGFRAISDAVREDGERARAELDALERRILRIGQGGGNGQRNANDPRRLDFGQDTRRAAPRLPSSGAGAGGRTSTKPDKELDLTNKALERYAEQLQTALERTKDLTAVEEALFFLRKQQGVSAEDAARVINLAKQVDAMRQLQAETEALADIDRALAEQRRAELQATEDRLKSLIDATPTAKLEETRKDMLLLAEALERGAISQSVYLEAVDERLGLTADKLEKTKSLAEELGLTFTSAFEDAIVSGKGFSDVLKGLEQDILRIVTRKLVTEPLGNAIGGIFGGGGSGGGLGSIFSKIGSAIFGSFDGGGYTGNGPRAGGLDGKGGYLAMVHPRESIIDHSRGQGMGATVTVNLVQNFAPGTSRATTLQAAADASRTLQQAARNL